MIRTLHRLNRFDFSGVDSDIIGVIYSTYLDRQQKKEKGQYYTPPAIVEYILDTIGYTDGRSIIGANKRILDPACGSGSLLVTAAKRLVAAYRDATASSLDPITVLERVQDTIFGFDLNPFACYLTEVNLLIQTLDLVKMARDAGGRPRLGRFNIHNVDALLTRIEAPCLLPTRAGSNGGKRVLRLGDVTDSTQGIIPLLTASEGATS